MLFNTLPYGNAVRSKIRDFRAALYPRQYHPSVLEKPLIQRFFAYKVFFCRTGQQKNEKSGVTAAKTEFRVDRQTEQEPNFRFLFLFRVIDKEFKIHYNKRKESEVFSKRKNF